MRMPTRLKTRLDSLVKTRLSSVIERYFARNSSTRYATIPAVTLSGDVYRFDFLVLFYNTTTDNQIMFGDDHGSNLYFNTYATTLSCWVSGVEKGFAFKSGNLRDGKFHTVSYVFSGTSLEAFIDGESLGVREIVPFVGTVNFKLYGSNSVNGARLHGILANLEMEVGGTQIRDYSLDDDGDILANRAASLGSNAFSGFDTLGAGCTDEGGGVYSWDGTQANDSYSVKPLGVVFASTQLITFTAEVVSGEVGVSMGVGGVRVSETGIYTQLILATNTTNISFGASASFIGTISNISIRRADGYGTVVNGNSEDIGLFQRKPNGDWQGKNLSVPPWDSIDQVLVKA